MGEHTATDTHMAPATTVTRRAQPLRVWLPICWLGICWLPIQLGLFPLRVWIPILRLLRWCVRWVRRIWTLRRIWWSWIPIRWLWRIWPLWLWIPLLLLLLLKCSTLGAESPAHDAAAWGMVSRKCRSACQDSVMTTTISKHPSFRGMIIISIYQLTYKLAPQE